MFVNSILEATNYEEEIEEASSDSNAMGQSLQNEETGITTHLSPKRAHILEQAINHKRKDSNAIITSSIALFTKTRPKKTKKAFSFIGYAKDQNF